MKAITLFLAAMLLLSTSALAVRSVIEPTAGAANGQSDVGWYALSTDGHYFNSSIDGKQILIVNTTTTATTEGILLTVIAGEYWREAIGDALFRLPVNATYILGPFESSRFKQYNETLLIDSNVSRGSVALVLLP